MVIATVPVVTFDFGDWHLRPILEAQAREIAGLLQKRAVETKARGPYQLALKIRGRAEDGQLGNLRLTQDERELLLPIVDTLSRGRPNHLLDWLSEALRTLQNSRDLLLPERAWIKTKNRDYWRYEMEREGALKVKRERQLV